MEVTRYDGIADRQIIEKLKGLIESGPIDAHVAKSFPPERAAKAHRALEGDFLGKLALRPGV